MVKVFTTDEMPRNAGIVLNNEIENWQKTFPQGITITNIHSNSNKFGWMVIISYTLNTPQHEIQ